MEKSNNQPVNSNVPKRTTGGCGCNKNATRTAREIAKKDQKKIKLL